MTAKNRKEVREIVLLDEIEKCEKDIMEALTQIPAGGRVRMLINSGGGSVYAGLGIATAIEMKKIHATGVVLADCSSSALLVFASCAERYVAPHASFLFHPMQWSSEERSRLPGALGWAREFRRIETACSRWICSRLNLSEALYKSWVRREVYVTAAELIELGVARYIPELEMEARVEPARAARRAKAPAISPAHRRARVIPAAARRRPASK